MTAAFRIRFGGYQGPESVHTRGMEAFAAALDDLTGGEVQVDLRKIDLTTHRATGLRRAGYLTRERHRQYGTPRRCAPHPKPPQRRRGLELDIAVAGSAAPGRG